MVMLLSALNNDIYQEDDEEDQGDYMGLGNVPSPLASPVGELQIQNQGSASTNQFAVGGSMYNGENKPISNFRQQFNISGLPIPYLHTERVGFKGNNTEDNSSFLRAQQLTPLRKNHSDNTVQGPSSQGFKGDEEHKKQSIANILLGAKQILFKQAEMAQKRIHLALYLCITSHRVKLGKILCQLYNFSSEGVQRNPYNVIGGANGGQFQPTPGRQPAKSSLIKKNKNNHKRGASNSRPPSDFQMPPKKKRVHFSDEVRGKQLAAIYEVESYKPISWGKINQQINFSMCLYPCILLRLFQQVNPAAYGISWGIAILFYELIILSNLPILKHFLQFQMMFQNTCSYNDLPAFSLHLEALFFLASSRSYSQREPLPNYQSNFPLVSSYISQLSLMSHDR